MIPAVWSHLPVPPEKGSKFVENTFFCVGLEERGDDTRHGLQVLQEYVTNRKGIQCCALQTIPICP